MGWREELPLPFRLWSLQPQTCPGQEHSELGMVLHHAGEMPAQGYRGTVGLAVGGMS